MGMASTQTWKVFIPVDILRSECGYLCGHVQGQMRHAFLDVKVLTKLKENQQNKVIGIWRSSKDSNCKTIGRGARSSARRKMLYWIDLDVNEHGSVTCYFACSSDPSAIIRCHCILFDPNDVLSSYVLTNKLFSKQSCDTISSLVNALTGSAESHFTSENTDNSNRCVSSENNMDLCHKLRRISYSNRLAYRFCQFLLWPLIYICVLVGTIFDNRWTKGKYAELFLDSPSITRQVRIRFWSLKKLLLHRDDTPLQRLSYVDGCFRQFVDSALGVCFLYIIVSGSLADSTADRIMDWADVVARSLVDLINWMMGAPAGLKLNSQLTHFLGHFFLYHIYLWTGYLSLLRPVLGALLQYSSFLGVLGVSAQLCLLQDIMSMMTVHIYCFYVYAARLYSFQVYALSSLWRLFRGKKWNVLRHRVDSAVYDIDQLFVGTLFFTILLFLLPTTLLYYVFFLTLRLGVVISQGMLSVGVRFTNQVPVYTVTMWLLGSSAVTGDVMFSVVPKSYTASSVSLTLQPCHIPLGQLLREIKLASSTSTQSDSLGTLLVKIVKGHLIYPWIDETWKSKEKSV